MTLCPKLLALENGILDAKELFAGSQPDLPSRSCHLPQNVTEVVDHNECGSLRWVLRARAFSLLRHHPFHHRPCSLRLNADFSGS